MTNPWGNRCWLLTSPRSGSTYLQYLLNLNVGVPIDANGDRETARYHFTEHLGELTCSIEEFFQWDPIVTRVHCHHFGEYNLPRQQIKELYPDVRFVLLERRDAYQQAVSLALSDRTGIQHCESEEQLQTYQQMSVFLSDEVLLRYHQAIIDYQAYWRNWLHGEPVLLITYESLLLSPISVVEQILDFLKTPHGEICLNVPLKRLWHPVNEKYVDRLRSLFQNSPHNEWSPESALLTT